ncbi:MAG: molecular chaperone [Pseudodesulfovibrio sp.]|uniref:TorD/DmsD family molecular chaperone n=1 Tax=Pseudodesulfovibrio sp. TaxID=2035812 RepID=UPI003D136A57
MATTDTLPVQRLFAGLAICYTSPDAETGIVLDELLTVAEEINDDFRSTAKKLMDSFSSIALEDLRVDHARLFVGPFSLLAHPFGSVYLEEGNLLMGESTVAVQELYREAGLDMSGDFRNPPDHIMAELEFYAYLLNRERDAQDKNDSDSTRRFNAIRRRFFADHLGQWGEEFASKVISNATTPFYTELGKLTKMTLEKESNLEG